MHTYAPESGCSWAIEKERKTEIGKEEEAGDKKLGDGGNIQWGKA
jgi:hypothetical protein